MDYQNWKISMEKLAGDYCGTSSNCGAAPGKDRRWFMHLPNMLGGFDLADACVCPDCLTRGRAEELVKGRN